MVPAPGPEGAGSSTRAGLLSHRRREWVFGVASAAAGLVVALIVVEVTLRVFHLAPVGGLATVSQKEFERVPGLFLPRQRLVDRSNPALPHLTSIDSLGYRGEGEFPRSKPAGELRVLMLGDSFTFGSYVDDIYALPVQLEALLRSRCSGAIRVINAGVGGSTIIEADGMAARALPLGIDLAVLTFTENDITDLLTPSWDELARNRAAKSRFPMSMVYPVVRNLAIWNLLLRVRGKLTTARREQLVSAPTGGAAPMALSSDSLREDYTNRLHQLRDRLQKAGIPLIFAVFPSHHSLPEAAPAELLNWAEKVGQKAGLPTVNYRTALRNVDGPSTALYLLPYDGHPSAKGYRVAAQSLTEQLLVLPSVARHCRTEPGAPPPLPED